MNEKDNEEKLPEENIEEVTETGAAPGASRKRKVVAGIASLAVIAGIGIAVACFGGGGATTLPADVKVEAKGKASKTEAVAWTPTIEAEGVTADSSALITRYTCTSGDAEGTEFYHATAASDALGGKDSVELEEGTWVIDALPVINPDGSITTPAGGGEQEVSSDSKDAHKTGFTGETKPADKVTQDDIDKVLDEVNDAVAKGDSTLTGDAGKDVIDKVTDNAGKAPAADRDKVEERKEETSDAAEKAEPVKPAASGKTDSKGDKGSSSGSGKGDKKSDGKGTSSSSDKGGSSAGKPAAHEHSWVAQYRTDPVYKTETYIVVDKEAWDEKKNADYDEFRFSDGYVTTSLSDAIAHQDATHCSYTVYTPQITVHHDAVTHQETRQVQSGTKQVLIGYRCSGCGATK